MITPSLWERWCLRHSLWIYKQTKRPHSSSLHYHTTCQVGFFSSIHPSRTLLSISAKVGILLPLEPQSGKEADVAKLLDTGYSLVVQGEPDTIHWFAVKIENADRFAIFDAFESPAGRQAHLDGQFAAALGTEGPNLLVPGSINIHQVDVLASKVGKGAATKTAGLSVGLKVIIEAKPEKVQTVKDFLIVSVFFSLQTQIIIFLQSALALVNQEPETPVWYAIQLPEAHKFAIIDFFADEAGRDAHLGGKVAEALFASVDELLTGAPDVAKLHVVAARIL